ncbi:MAG: hypothetical protein AMXMBFR80_16730 [Dehalococcoidia bacterium]
MAGLGQPDANPGALAPQELMRHLHEHAGSVAGVRFASGCTPVVQVLQRGQTVLHHLVRAVALQVDNEPHAATVTLELRAV